MDCKAILSKMTSEDKISLCTGADFWHSKKMAQGLLEMANGHFIRGIKAMLRGRS